MTVVKILEKLRDGELSGLEAREGDDPANAEEQNLEDNAEGSDSESCRGCAAQRQQGT